MLCLCTLHIVARNYLATKTDGITLLLESGTHQWPTFTAYYGKFSIGKLQIGFITRNMRK